MKTTRLAGLCYFAFNLATGSLDPLMSVLLSRCLASPAKVGAVLSARPIFGLVAGPLWTALADRRGDYRAVATVCTLASAASALLFAMLVSAAENAAAGAGTVPLLLLAAPVCALSFFRAPIVPLLDASAMRSLGENGRERYGTLRVWGGVSFGIAGTLAGSFFLPRFGSLFPPLAFAALIVLFALPSFLVLLSSHANALPAKKTATTDALPFWKALRVLAATPGVPAFSLMLVSMGIAGGTLTHVVPLVIAADKSASKSVLGFSVGVSVLSELPVFPLSAWLLRRFGSRTLLLVAQAAMAVRLGAYAGLVHGNMLLLPQTLHGLSFALMWTSVVVFAGQIAPKEVAATAQGLVFALYVCLANIIAGALNGVLLARFGPTVVFRVAATICAVSFMVFWAFTPRHRPAKKEDKVQ